ncbi:MAG: hypothetical protein EBS55_12000 [Flavobacteriaceae bacterium]|nr:hypothetical protein [Flavobacteriaceae bacterium]
MIDLTNVTLVAVASVRVDKTIKALKYSSKDINFKDVKLITNEIVDEPNIEVINVEKMDYEHYNKFIVFELYKYIDTDFALIIQDDGFVVNPDNWNPDFLNYDYLGAPWPLPQDNFSYRDISGNLVRVGNGGFSLRSKKLLSLASELNLEWKSYFGFHNEDGFFSCHNRHIYEQHGCVFAPIDVAKHFSHEIQIPETEGITPFGFHGKNNPYANLI